ncbi:MAG: paraquat-inducible protein A [Chthoniobacterales bacterium]
MNFKNSDPRIVVNCEPPATNCKRPLQSKDFCPECSAPYIDRLLHPGESLLCSRCGKRLKKYSNPDSLQTLWTLVTAALIFLFMANVTPIMVFDVSGNTQSNLMITGVESLFSQGYWPLAILVFFSAIALPTLHLTLFWYLLGGCCLRRPWPGLKPTLSLVEILMPWNLIPVFAVGVMAAVVKLEQLGNIHWKTGALWIALLAIVSLVVVRFFDRTLFEEIIAGLEKS